MPAPPSTQPAGPPSVHPRQRVRRCSLIYLAVLLLIAALFRFVGEEAWWLWLPLFFPLGFWLLPMLVLLPMAWKKNRRMLPVLALCAGVVFVMSGWRWSPAPAHGEGRKLSIVSYNIGENNGTSPLAFVEKHQPDLFLLQSCGFRYRSVSRYRVGDAEVHTRQVGRHELQSRHPILSAEAVHHPGFPGAIAAEFLVDWEGEPLTVYSVHLPTPRADFLTLMGRRGPKLPFPERFRHFRAGLRERSLLLETLLKRVRETEGAVIVAGDFNMPAWGRFYPRICSELIDAFARAGRGTGFTFPGHDPYIPAPFGPWVRLDYIFCNQRWQPIAFETESGRASQHLAIAATLELQP